MRDSETISASYAVVDSHDPANAAPEWTTLTNDLEPGHYAITIGDGGPHAALVGTPDELIEIAQRITAHAFSLKDAAQRPKVTQ